MIASDSAGQRLALDHVRVSAFENHQEERLQPIVEALQGEARLDLPDRCSRLRFYPNFLDRASPGMAIWSAAPCSPGRWIRCLLSRPAAIAPFTWQYPSACLPARLAVCGWTWRSGNGKPGCGRFRLGIMGPPIPSACVPVIQKALAGKAPPTGGGARGPARSARGTLRPRLGVAGTVREFFTLAY